MKIGGSRMKDKRSYYTELSRLNRAIQYYRQMINISYDPLVRMFYADLMYHAVTRLYHLQMYSFNIKKNREKRSEQEIKPNQKEFTIDELAQYDGSNGRPAYVAIHGIVYDVSLEATWGGGTHFGIYAGRDLTVQFNRCHGNRPEILQSLPQVGILKA